MDTIGKRRLATLARRLEKLQATPKKKRPREFDMRYWQVDVRDGGQVCGTAACALGEATFIPSFKRAGLYMHATDSKTPDYEVRLRVAPNADYFGYTAAGTFFDIPYQTAVKLFSPSRYPDPEADHIKIGEYKKITPGVVAARIRNVIANDGYYVPPVKVVRRKAV